MRPTSTALASALGTLLLMTGCTDTQDNDRSNSSDDPMKHCDLLTAEVLEPIFGTSEVTSNGGPTPSKGGRLFYCTITPTGTSDARRLKIQSVELGLPGGDEKVRSQYEKAKQDAEDQYADSFEESDTGFVVYNGAQVTAWSLTDQRRLRATVPVSADRGPEITSDVVKVLTTFDEELTAWDSQASE